MSGTANSSTYFQLNQANLGQISAKLKIPKYDRSKMTSGIVHLGLGGFHRAHMARYTHELMEIDPSALSWAITGTGLMPYDKKMSDSLNPQNSLYTLLERDGKLENAAIIGSIAKVVFAGEDTTELLAEIDKSSTKIVSLTVTENGYCLNPITKVLDLAHPLIKKDLATPEKPVSAIGVIVESLRRRRDKQQKPFAVMSCDNIQHNGHVLHDAVIGLAKMRAPALAEWIEKNVTFPNTMVDRITPVTKPEDVEHVRKAYDIEDAWPVVSEAYTQWVVEDKFVQGRPAWEKVGVQFVKDVEPYEVMKLRLLNASHLAIACLGDVGGYTFVDETMADPRFQKFMTLLMDKETGPTLAPVPGIDLPKYKKTLVERFANSAIKDTVQRVATDAPLNTLLAPIEDRLKANQNVDLLSLALAGWMRRVRGDKNEVGRQLHIRHPMADLLAQKAKKGGDNPAALLSIVDLFGNLCNDKRLVEPLAKHLGSIYKIGAFKTIESAIAPHT